MIVIGIAGASGSGKSLLASTIVSELGSDQVTVITEDCYYRDCSHLSSEMRASINFDHPKAFNHDLLVQHIMDLRQGKAIELPLYDYATHTTTSEIRNIPPNTILVLEGILIFSERRLRHLMDIRIFIDTPLDLCLTRRMQRDIVERGRTIKSVISQYKRTVRPMFLKFIEPSKKYADLIVPKGGKNRVAIEIIKAKMRDLLIKKDNLI